MKKTLKVDINDYTILQVLYLLISLTTDKQIELQLKKVINFLERHIYNDFFASLGDVYILNEDVKIEYTLKN